MSKKQIAVITGANSGFGREFVKIVSQRDDVSEIWAVARNEEKLKLISEEFGDQIRTFSMDLTDRECYGRLQEYLNNEDVNVKYLVNNAGFAKFCSYDDIGVNESLNMIDLNIGAVVALGLICIPHMEKGSHIINIASQASFFPLPYQNIYSSTKSFVRNYTRALNVELKDRGIHAIAVCPGWMKTGLLDRGTIGAEKATTNFVGLRTPEDVARKAFKDTLKGKDMSTYGAFVKVTHVLSKIVPQRFVMKVWLKQQKL